MKKNFTQLLSSRNAEKLIIVNSDLGPRQDTLSNIMKFASTYRAKEFANKQYIEYFLN